MEQKDAWEKFCEEYNQNEEERLRETVNKLKSELGKGGFVFENITAGEYRANLYSKKCGSLADELIERGITPVKHGNWIYNTDDFTPAKRCSCCGYNKPIAAGERLTKEPENYCPNCGAKMDGGEKNEENR